MSRMPLAFLGHGSPMNALEDNAWTREWEALGRRLPRPAAILCVSAHYETRGLFLTGNAAPRTIHDFFGFPPALHQAAYPAPGSPALAERAAALLGGRAGISDDWGLDHGAWSVLMRMYPQADVPVVQLSLDVTLPPEEQLSIGRALAPLRDEGVLLLGSGNVVHNLREIAPGKPEPFPWAAEFGEAVHELVTQGRYQALAGYEKLPGSARSVPTAEHFLPLPIVLGAAGADDRVSFLNHEFLWGSLSMTGYVLTET